MFKQVLKHNQAVCLGIGIVLANPFTEVSAEKPTERGILKKQLGVPVFNVIVCLRKKKADSAIFIPPNFVGNQMNSGL